MRRLLLLLAAALVLLCACGRGETLDSQVRTVEYGGRTYEVNRKEQTISFGGGVAMLLGIILLFV